MSTLTRDALDEVRAERENQDVRWGEQNHPDGTGADEKFFGVDMSHICRSVRMRTNRVADEGNLTWLDILLEEVFEAAEEPAPALLREELVQVAAVATAWIECIDRRARA